MLSVVFSGNWGLGLEIVKALESDSRVCLELIISHFDPRSDDPWFNAVYQYALEFNRPVLNERVLTIQDLKNHLKHIKPELMITHAFMQRLPRAVFALPRLGTLNIHPSLLPAYRGPAPSYWVLHNAETHTGLTAHLMDEGLDTGPIVAQQIIPVEAHDTVTSLIEKMKPAVKPLISESLDRLTDPHFQPLPQQSGMASYAPRPVENPHEKI